jgi:sterol desaturase/sphingolipid hydroxylase (fatty acid hydroxylase superfamily)
VQARAVLPWLTWWLVMGGTLVGAAWLCGGEPITPRVLGIATLVNSAGIALLEQLLGRVPGTNLLRDRQSWNDMIHGVLMSQVGRPLGTAGAAWLLAGASGLAGGPLPWPSQAPFAVQFALVLLIWSFADYWVHRAQHTFSFLWWFHALHHDTAQMHLLKSGRFHIVDPILTYPLKAGFLLLFAPPAEAVLWLGVWQVADGNLAHCNLDQRFRSAWHWVLPTVQNHYLHHAAERRLQDSNYSGEFPLWDVVFGTYHHPDRHPVARTGLEGDPIPRDLWGQLAYPFRALRASRAAPR